MTTPKTQLCSKAGACLPLTGVTIQAHLQDLLFRVEVEQRYRNTSDLNIEVVYTFPLPPAAVLLEVSVTLGERTLHGVAVEKKQAEERYEEAVCAGDTAILLQQAGEDGLYTLNLGNLLAQEEAIIRFRYALLATWQDNRLRLLLPTVLAPRYGDAQRQGNLAAHQVPVTDLQADYPLTVAMTVEGLLAQAQISSPSHALTVQRSGEGLRIGLAEQARLDRDVVVVFTSEAAHNASAVEVQGMEHVVLASFRPLAPAGYQPQPLALKLLVDCSGSMAGDSIAQARAGLSEILNQLQPCDQFSLSRFGSRTEHLFQTLHPVNEGFLRETRHLIVRMDADLGGTEMVKALEAVFQLRGSPAQSDVLLITDGEIWDVENLIQSAKTSGHRLFVVGVGSAVAEGVVRRLAEETGGALELVTPREAMAERIVRQFQRMRQPRADHLQVEWPEQPLWSTPLPNRIFAGDTLHLWAGFAKPVTGSVRLQLAYGESSVTSEATVAIGPKSLADDLPRLAAGYRLQALPEDEARALALRYQLISPHTHYLMIVERAEEEKAADLPQLATVPQMQAAGWGGMGSVMPAAPARFIARMSPAAADMNAKDMLCCRVSPAETDFFMMDDFTPLNVIMEQAPMAASLSSGSLPPQPLSPEEFIAWLNACLATQSIISLNLADLPLNGAILEKIRNLLTQEWPEQTVIVAFLLALVKSPVSHLFERHVARLVRKTASQQAISRELELYFEQSMETIMIDDWNWCDVNDVPIDSIPNN